MCHRDFIYGRHVDFLYWFSQNEQLEIDLTSRVVGT